MKVAGACFIVHKWILSFYSYIVLHISYTDLDITDRAIQVEGAREGQSFDLKVYYI
jgi:hypothetical protein